MEKLPWYGWRSGPVMSPSLPTDVNYIFFVKPAHHIGGFGGKMGPIAVLGQISNSPLILALIWSRNGREAGRAPDKEENVLQFPAQCSEDVMKAQLRGERG